MSGANYLAMTCSAKAGLVWLDTLHTQWNGGLANMGPKIPRKFPPGEGNREALKTKTMRGGYGEEIGGNDGELVAEGKGEAICPLFSPLPSPSRAPMPLPPLPANLTSLSPFSFFVFFFFVKVRSLSHGP